MAAEREYGLEIAATFTYPHEAHVAKSLLDSRGIYSQILDETQIRMRWHLSAALGGIKIAVHPNDLEEARALLATDFSGDLVDTFESELEPDGREICPRCALANVALVRQEPRFSFRTLFGLLLSALSGAIFPMRTVVETRTCSRCGEEWRVEAPR